MQAILQRERKRTKERGIRIWLSVMVIAGGLDLAAHDSPEHEIEALNKKIAANGATAELLGRRAAEWRALGKYDEASEDLRKAFLINSNSIPLLLEFASVELERGNVCNARAIIECGLTCAQGTERAPLQMMMAEIAERRGLYDFALADCEKAMSSGEPQLEWHLTQARLMCRLGQYAKAAAALKDAFERTPNVVLEIEWIEAMIDAGHAEEALRRIAKYSGGRWRSAWLIRQARAELALNRREPAEANLKVALAELEQRMNPTKPDAMLLADRAMARLLRGERDAAARDMERIERMPGGQVPPSTLVRLERLFRESK